MRSLVALALVALAACATNPVTGKRQFTLVSQSQEIEMGKQGAEEVKATIGVIDDARVRKYVSDIGLRIAATTERPKLPWTFDVVNDAAVNAFALPGGYVFVTRGLLTHLNSEAELATVLGHEIGHVTARHSVSQISKAQIAQVGLGVGSIFSQNIAKYGQIAGAGLSLAFMKFGRDDESQADELGFKYALANDYDVRAMDDVFVTLNRVGQSSGGGRMPEWLSTHPNPENRIAATNKRLATVKGDLSKTKLGREELMNVINGLPFGEDPRQGYFAGQAFLHPGLKFRLDFPAGWKTQNMPEAVAGGSQAEDAILQLTAGDGKTTPEQAMAKFSQQEGLKVGAPEKADFHGIPATVAGFEGQTQEGALKGLVAFLSYGGKTFLLAGYSAAPKFPSYEATFKQAMASFAPLTDPAALAVQPAKLEVVKLAAPLTLDQFMTQYPSSIPKAQVALINGVEQNATFPAGALVKRVTGGPAPKPAVSSTP